MGRAAAAVHPFTPHTCLFSDGLLYKGDTSTHAQGTDLEGGLVERPRVRWPPVLKARRRHKRQHLHLCRKCQRRRHRLQ